MEKESVKDAPHQDLNLDHATGQKRAAQMVTNFVSSIEPMAVMHATIGLVLFPEFFPGGGVQHYFSFR